MALLGVQGVGLGAARLSAVRCGLDAAGLILGRNVGIAGIMDVHGVPLSRAKRMYLDADMLRFQRFQDVSGVLEWRWMCGFRVGFAVGL